MIQLEELKKIAESGKLQITEVINKLRNNRESFYRTLKRENLTVKEFEKFCEECDCEIRVYNKKSKKRIF